MQNKLKFLIPSIADIFYFILFLTLALSTPSTLLIDCDTGLHIRIGEFILDSFSIPQYDIFFATNPPVQYIAYEWLSQAIMAIVYRLSGLTGIVIFFSFLIAFAYYLLFRILIKENSNVVIVALCISLLVIPASSIHWTARPHIFSILILIVWYYILDLYQYKNRNYLYILPFIMLLWVNLHGAFILGFVLCGIYFLGNIIQIFLIQDPERVVYKTKAKKILFIMSLLIMASLFNPNGLKGLLQPVTVVSDKFLINHISEYASPNFHNPNYFQFGILLLFIIVTFALSNRKRSIMEIILVVLFTSMALYSVRNIPLFAIIMAPILVRRSEQIPSGKNRKFIDFPDTGNQNISEIKLSARDYFWLILPVISILGFAMSGYINRQFDEKIKPVAAVEFLKHEHVQGNMYNEYEFGTYIIYRAYPQYRVFIDGRAEMYGAEWFKEYYRIKKVKPGWDKILEKYDVNFIIISNDSILSQFLLNNITWRLIYSDKIANIFIKNTLKNKLLIEKYRNVKPVVLENNDKNL